MSPDVRKTLVPASYLRKELVVFDIVYNPLKTRLLSSAERKGAKTITGLEMFIHQAAIQFEEWTSLSAPFKTMKLAAQRALGK
jgi:shikimate dehydrogenase